MAHEPSTDLYIGTATATAPASVANQRGTRQPTDGPQETTHRHRPWIFALIVMALLAQMTFGMVTAARQQSPVVDEPVYVGTSVVYLQQRSLEYNYEHPPLAKLIIATGLVFADARVAPTSEAPSGNSATTSCTRRATTPSTCSSWPGCR